MEQWFTTLYAPCISGPSSACVLDLILAGCDNVLFRFGAALLVLLETHLITMSAEELMMVDAILSISAFDWIVSRCLVVLPQNFKPLVRGVEHATLVLTALSFPDSPDVLVTWLAHGFTKLGDVSSQFSPSHLPSDLELSDVELAVLGYVDDAPATPADMSTGLILTAVDSPLATQTCCATPHARIRLIRSAQVDSYTVRTCCPAL